MTTEQVNEAYRDYQRHLNRDGMQYPEEFAPGMVGELARLGVAMDSMAAKIQCGLNGHDWQSDDFASPDSGYMGCSCRRCGKSVGQWLY